MFEQFEKLFIPFPDDVKTTTPMGKKGEITYVEWYHHIARAWRDFPQGFSTQITKVFEFGGHLVMVIRVTNEATGCYQEASGSAKVDKEKSNYGGATAEAESQALRRAFAKHGLGLEMYMDDEDRHQVEKPARKDQIERMKYLIGLIPKGEDGDELRSLVEKLREEVANALDKEKATLHAISHISTTMDLQGIEYIPF